MSEETQAPSASTETAPAAPAPPKGPTTSRDWIAQARGKMQSMGLGLPDSQPVSSTAPTDPAPAASEPVAESAAPSAAASVLGGAVIRPPEAPAPEAIDASDPRAMTAMAQIIALEQAARQREQELSARGQKLLAWEKAEAAKGEGKLLDALDALGISYEDLTAYVVRGDAKLSEPTEALRQLEARLEAEAAERKALEERLTQQQQAAAEARVQAYKADIAAKLKADTARWELLQSPVGNEGRNPVDLIESTIEAHFYATGGAIDQATGALVGGERLTWDAAADMLEAEIERRTREAATVGGEKLRRILGLTAPVAPTSPPPVQAPAPTHAAPTPTPTTEVATRSPEPGSMPRHARDWRAAGLREAARHLKGR